MRSLSSVVTQLASVVADRVVADRLDDVTMLFCEQHLSAVAAEKAICRGACERCKTFN